MALDLFFPNGKSKQGKLEEFTVDILDYQENAVLDDDVTVGEHYAVLKMGVLRFYLCTKVKDVTDTEDTVDADLAESQHGNASLSSNTSEVIIGAHVGEPMIWQLDDTVPILTSDEEAPEVDIVRTCSALLSSNAGIVINEYSSSDPTPANEQGDILCVTPSTSFSPSETSTPTKVISQRL